MDARWKVRRSARADDAGQRRWDLAYQCLLQWSAPPPAAVQTAGPGPREEHGDGRGVVRTGFDQAAAADPDH